MQLLHLNLRGFRRIRDGLGLDVLTLNVEALWLALFNAGVREVAARGLLFLSSCHGVLAVQGRARALARLRPAAVFDP